MRLRIGTGFGIPIYLHWTFLLLPFWIYFTRPSDAETDLALVFTVVPLVFGCVVLHELGHALAARYYGIGTHDITLYPIGGVARLKRMTDKPLEEFIIAVAGPAVNVVIAVVLVCILLPIGVFQPMWVLKSFPGMIGLWLLIVNLFMVAFNMLPAFPMDGGRVLRAILASWLGLYQGTHIAVGIGMGMAILIGLGGVMLLGNWMLVVIAVFVLFAGQQELAAVRYREQMRWEQEIEEALLVLPVLPIQAIAPCPIEPPLLYQPTVAVYTFDNHTGLWAQRIVPAHPKHGDDMKALLTRLDKWLAQHRKAFHDNLLAGASARQLDALSKKLGQPLPADLRTLLSWHNGQGEDHAGYFEGHWLLMSSDMIAAARAELDATADDTGWKKEWIPFLDDDGGNYLVLDTSKKEPAVLGYYGDENAKKVAPSLKAWITEFVKAVEAGEYYEEPERGTFKRGKTKSK